MHQSVAVLIPCFNEESTVLDVLKSAVKYSYGSEIVLVDDGSTDNSIVIANSIGVKYVRLPFNLGLGTALQTGYNYAYDNGYDYIVQIDSDGQHDPKYLPEIINMLKTHEADLVIGSRYLVKNAKGSSWLRRIGSRIFSAILFALTREKITDPTSGYQGMNRAVLSYCISDKFNFDYPDADFILSLHKAGFRIKEVPMVMHERKSGTSMHNGLKPVYYVLKMILSLFIITLRGKN